MPGGTLRHGWEEPVRGCEAQRTGSGLGRRKPEFYARLGPDLALRAAVLHQPLPSLGGQGQGQAETGCGGRWAQRSLPSSSLLRPHCWSLFAHLARCQGCPGQQSSTQEIGSLRPEPLASESPRRPSEQDASLGTPAGALGVLHPRSPADPGAFKQGLRLRGMAGVLPCLTPRRSDTGCHPILTTRDAGRVPFREAGRRVPSHADHR